MVKVFCERATYRHDITGFIQCKFPNTKRSVLIDTINDKCDESPKKSKFKIKAEFKLLESIGVAFGANLVCSTKEQ